MDRHAAVVFRQQLWVNASALVDARRSDGMRVSQAAVFTMIVNDERLQNYGRNPVKFPRQFSGIVGFGIPPYATAEMEVTAPICVGRAQRCRFKIIAVTAC